MRPVLCILLLFIPLISHPQDVVFAKHVRLHAPGRSSFPIINSSDESLSFFLLDNTSIKGLLFDKSFNLLDSISAVRPEALYTKVLGTTYSNEKYNIVFSNSNHTNIKILSYSYINKTILRTLVNLPLKREKVLGSFTSKDKFFILTIVKASSVLKLYSFNDQFNHEIKTYDFSGNKFSSNDYYRLSDVMMVSEPVVIDTNIPAPLDEASSKNKLYCYDNKIILTLNNQSHRTGLITIDLTSFSSSLKFYDQGIVNCTVTKNSVNYQYVNRSSNSYIHNNILYQLFACPSGIAFSIVDLNTGNIINELSATKDEEDIWFKNSAILKEEGSDVQEIESTSKFYKKLSTLITSISVEEAMHSIVLKLGGYEEIKIAYPDGSPLNGTIVGSDGVPHITSSFMPTYWYDKKNRLIYFKSVLNPTTHQHMEGKAPTTAYDQVQSFIEKHNNKLTGEVIFKINGAYVMGYYLKNDHTYNIVKF